MPNMRSHGYGLLAWRALYCAMALATGMLIWHMAPRMMDDEPYVYLPQYGRIRLDVGNCAQLDGWKFHINVIERLEAPQATCVPFQVVVGR